MIDLAIADPEENLRPHIAVVGVGGAGGNALNNMIRAELEGCDFIAANTDSQALAMSLASRKIQLGVKLSRGLGAGSKPDVGCAAAEEQTGEIVSHIEGADMLFVTAGMGGGTGTGAAPVIARLARELGILTVGVVTKPFNFEGTQRMRQAEKGIAELQKYVDTLIIIPNQNLFRIANERTTFAEAFRLADEVLRCGVQGITDLMIMPGFMNLDFADVKTVMGEMGKAMMGTGEAEGENRAIRAAEAAISNPLLDDVSMKGARGVLINITGGLDMTLFEVDQAANRVREEVDPDAQIKVGSTLGESLEGRIRVSIIATGIDSTVPVAITTTAASRSGNVSGGGEARGGASSDPKNTTQILTPDSSSHHTHRSPSPRPEAHAIVNPERASQAAFVTSQHPSRQRLSGQHDGSNPPQERGYGETSGFVEHNDISRPARSRAAGTYEDPDGAENVSEETHRKMAATHFLMPSPVTPDMMRVQDSLEQSESQSRVTVAVAEYDDVAYPLSEPLESVDSVHDDRQIYPQVQDGQVQEVSVSRAQEALYDVQKTAVYQETSRSHSAASQGERSDFRGENSRGEMWGGNRLAPQTSSHLSQRGQKNSASSTSFHRSSPSDSVVSTVAARSQSLFQRITGFGSSNNREDYLSTARDGVQSSKGHVTRGTEEAETEDYLDIPAFLRRQTNS